MIYLFLGDDLAAKDAAIAGLKAKFFQNIPGALLFDFEAMDAQEMSAQVLKKALTALPAIAPKRLIVLRRIHKLKPADNRILLDFCRQPCVDCDLVLESSEKTLRGELKDLASHAKTMVFTGAQEHNVFDMTRLMTARRTVEALKMLDGFYRDHQHPLQIMGGLVWYWGKQGRGLGQTQFEAGLKALEEADLNIKRSRFDPYYAVEKLVVELTELQK